MSERKRVIWITAPNTAKKQLVIDVDAIEYAADRGAKGIEIQFKSGKTLTLTGESVEILDRIVREWTDGNIS